jgi:hypothetical protein
LIENYLADFENLRKMITTPTKQARELGHVQIERGWVWMGKWVCEKEIGIVTLTLTHSHPHPQDE